MSQKTVIVVGAGIVGLALARAFAARGRKVTVFDRHERAVGASVRNFGMIWPIGVPNGRQYQRALASRAVWREFCEAVQVWYDPAGCLHAAYADDEMAVIEAYVAANAGTRSCEVLTAAQAAERAPGIVRRDLAGALWSADEMVLDPRVAMRALPQWLAERYGVEFRWKQAVTRVEHPAVWSGGRRYLADDIYIAGGADFEALYPALFERLPIVRRKFRMLRLDAPPDGFRLGVPLCGGLSMLYHPGFQATPGIAALRERYLREHAELLAHGTHVLAVQNGRGEIALGDSPEHEHGHGPATAAIDRQVAEYLGRFVDLPDGRVVQSSQGMCTSLADGGTELVVDAEPGVTIVNGLGRFGLTLAFGLAEEIAAGDYREARSWAAWPKDECATASRTSPRSAPLR